jgi:S1-C subfamily serine protease
VKPGGPAEAVGLRIGDVLLSSDGKAADSLPIVSFHLLSLEQGEKVHFEVLRGKLRLAFDVPVAEHPHDMDQVASLADPQKNLVLPLGILGVEIDDSVARMIPGLRDPFGIIVAARAAGAAPEIPLAAGDVIRMLNGEPMTTLVRLREALKTLSPGSAVALQIQRDDRLLYISFTLDQQ